MFRSHAKSEFLCSRININIFLRIANYSQLATNPCRRRLRKVELICIFNADKVDSDLLGGGVGLVQGVH